MCAVNDPKTLRSMRRRTKKIEAWKIIHISGKALYQDGFLYKAGWNHATDNLGNKLIKPDYQGNGEKHHCGCHAYIYEQNADSVMYWMTGNYMSVRVQIDPKDVIACEFTTNQSAQIVARRVFISKKDWATAQERWAKHG